jgi:glycosyltransferase involved in cell wall biosynthesis
MLAGPESSLKILHVLRAPVGGLFRHVVDLARGQAARGHRVGLVADSSLGGTQAETTLTALAPMLALGLTRVPMSRQLGPRDIAATRHVSQRAEVVMADVIHGHGAKGGAYARLARGSGIRVYTPHGGSLHYRWNTTVGFLYLSLERVLLRRTDLFLFESAFGRDAFQVKIGEPKALVRVVHNGVSASEFEPAKVGPQATDLLFVGEQRMLKGVDVLIEAIALLARGGTNASLTIVGEGPDRATFEAAVRSHGLEGFVRFVGAKPARAAFALGRTLVVPSRAESLPYIVLEAAAAGVPLLVTNVGGIPEIFGPDADGLLPPADPGALARAIGAALKDRTAGHAAALALQARVRTAFSVDTMTDGVIAAYRAALALRNV